MQESITREVFREKNKTFVKPPKEGKALFFVMPSSSGESTYDLRVLPDGEVKCSCKGHVLGGFRCTHIKNFLKIYNEEYECFSKEINPKEVVERNQVSEVISDNDGIEELVPVLEI